MITNEYKKYLNIILDEYYSIHLNPEHNISKEKVYEYINNYILNHEIINNYTFRYFILHILKLLNGNRDTHTTLDCKYSLPLPFELKYLQDGFYVIDSIDKEIMYSKLIKINGINVEDICKKMAEITSYETILWLYLKEQLQLKDIYYLKMFPEIGSKTEEFIYTFIKNEKIINKKYNRNSVINLKNNKFDDNATFKIFDNKIVYKLNSCLKDEKYGFKEKIDSSCKKLNEIIEPNNIKEFILDLRGNSGGSDVMLSSLYELFNKYIDKIQFKVLVDRKTFSCGTIILRYLLEHGNVITIGEGIGESFNAFGNYSSIVDLGNAFRFHVSNKYYCFNDNHLLCIDDKEKYNSLSDEQKQSLDFTPDIIVNESIDDIINKDSQLLHFDEL